MLVVQSRDRDDGLYLALVPNDLTAAQINEGLAEIRIDPGRVWRSTAGRKPPWGWRRPFCRFRGWSEAERENHTGPSARCGLALYGLPKLLSLGGIPEGSAQVQAISCLGQDISSVPDRCEGREPPRRECGGVVWWTRSISPEHAQDRTANACSNRDRRIVPYGFRGSASRRR